MAYGRIGVIGAMDSELAALIAALTQPAQETVQGLVFRTGRLGAREVVLVRCGIGKVSAARCTQVLIDRFAPGAVINTGIAGGLASGLAVGDIVVADGLVQHDFDAAVQVRQLAQPPLQHVVFQVRSLVENLLVRQKGDLRTGLFQLAGSDHSQLFDDLAPLIALLVNLAVLVNANLQPGGKGIYNRRAYAMQAALYPPPPNLPPACRMVKTTSTAGIPAFF